MLIFLAKYRVNRYRWVTSVCAGPYISRIVQKIGDFSVTDFALESGNYFFLKYFLSFRK